MEKDGETARASRHPDRNRYGSIRRILSGICEMERGRGVYYTAWDHRKDPSGYWQQVPQVSIAQTYLKIMNKFCEQFGLTPSARSRISTDSGEDKQNDEMEPLLVKGGAG